MKTKDTITFLPPPIGDERLSNYVEHAGKVFDLYFSLSPQERHDKKVLIELPYLNTNMYGYSHTAQQKDAYCVHAIQFLYYDGTLTICPGIGRTMRIKDYKVDEFLPFQTTLWDYAHRPRLAYLLNGQRVEISSVMNEDEAIQKHYGIFAFASFASVFHEISFLPSEKEIQHLKDSYLTQLMDLLTDRLNFIPISVMPIKHFESFSFQSPFSRKD